MTIDNRIHDKTRFRITAGLVFALIALGCGGTEPADLLITGGTIYTLDPGQPKVEAVAVSGDVIVFAGDLARAARFKGPRTLVLDIAGHTALPGLVDAHAHLMGLGDYLSELQLAGTASADTIRQMVIAWKNDLGAGAWILGRGWDQNNWETQEFPTVGDLAGTESHPVFLRRVDGHAAWLNTTALEILGITRDTPDPPGGLIVRDADGNPTGVLADNAKDDAWDLVPEPSLEEKTRRLKSAIRECQSFGLTGVHDAGTEEDELEILRQLRDDGALGLRVYSMLETEDSTFVARQFERGAVVKNPYLVVRAIKVYADGALGSRGAALIEPYSDDLGNRGLMVNTPDVLHRWARLAAEYGWQMCVHAIGDAGNRAVLDAYEEALGSAGSGDRRFRIEHAQVVAPGDIERIAKLGIIAAMQPTHATSDMYWAEKRLGATRIQGAYAWRKVMDVGAVIACGSDFPVEAVNPLWGIYAATTRQDHQGWPTNGWYPEERMTVEEAVRGFTTNAAFAGFTENKNGTIERGKLADFTIIDRDVFVVPPAEILETRAVYTIVGGEIVFAARDSIDHREEAQ
jgi:predicted amidohydrolase YtcJ